MKQPIVCLFLLILVVGFVHPIERKLCNCRLENGRSKSDNPVPWLALLRENKRLICGSFIINDRLLITSASCVHNKTVESLDVITGTFDLSKVKKKNVHQVDSIKVHPLFNGTKHNNIGLIRLKKAIKLKTGRVESSCLELSYNNGYYNDELLLVGYGSNRTAARNTPKYSHLKISEQMPIESKLIHGTVLDESVCEGDIGNALHYTYPSTNLTYSVAINSFLSFGDKRQTLCSDHGAYFTRLSGQRDFIAENVRIHC